MTGTLWGLFAFASVAVLLVVFVRRLRQVSDGPGTLVAAGVVSLLVVAGVVVLLLLR